MYKVLVVATDIKSHCIAEEQLSNEYTVIGAQSESSAISFIRNTDIDHVIIDFAIGLQSIDRLVSSIIDKATRKILFSVVSIKENTEMLKNFSLTLKTA